MGDGLTLLLVFSMLHSNCELALVTSSDAPVGVTHPLELLFVAKVRLGLLDGANKPCRCSPPGLFASPNPNSSAPHWLYRRPGSLLDNKRAGGQNLLSAQVKAGYFCFTVEGKQKHCQ